MHTGCLYSLQSIPTDFLFAKKRIHRFRPWFKAFWLSLAGNKRNNLLPGVLAVAFAFYTTSSLVDQSA